MANLPTNYTDSTWTGPKKYKMTNNPDGTVSFEDVTVYTNRQNSFFGAKDANQINEAVNNIVAHQAEYDNKLSPITQSGAGNHNSIYRGKYLGTTFTQEQLSNIKNGSFTDLYVGDFWVIDGVLYTIAAIDYYFNIGRTPLQKHHIVIVTNDMAQAQMINTASGQYEAGGMNRTDYGYANSDMYITNLRPIKNTVSNAFGNNILSHETMLTIFNGEYEWRTVDVDIPNVGMIYGGYTILGSSLRVEKTQFPLFTHDPERLHTGYTYWLKDITSPETYSVINNEGRLVTCYSTARNNVRVVFCVG